MTHWKLPIRIIKSWSLQILTTTFALLKCTLSFVSSDPNVCSDVLSLCCLQLNIKLFSGWILPAPRALLKADSCHVSKKKKQKKKEKKKKTRGKNPQNWDYLKLLMLKHIKLKEISGGEALWATGRNSTNATVKMVVLFFK